MTTVLTRSVGRSSFISSNHMATSHTKSSPPYQRSNDTPYKYHTPLEKWLTYEFITLRLPTFFCGRFLDNGENFASYSEGKFTFCMSSHEAESIIRYGHYIESHYTESHYTESHLYRTLVKPSRQR